MTAVTSASASVAPRNTDASVAPAATRAERERVSCGNGMSAARWAVDSGARLKSDASRRPPQAEAPRQTAMITIAQRFMDCGELGYA